MNIGFFKEFENLYKKEIPVTSLLFNIFLVLNRGREAMLLEVDTIEYIEKIKENFPSLVITPIENSFRAFVSREALNIDELPKDEKIAEILGFSCKGLPDPYKIRWALYYYVNGENFYTELCAKRKSFKVRAKEWSKLAGEDTKITYSFEKVYPDNFITDIILTGEFFKLKEHMGEFLTFLYNLNIDFTDEKKFKDPEGFVDQFINNRKWLIFLALVYIYEPYRFRVLNKEESEKLTEAMTTLILENNEPKLPPVNKIIENITPAEKKLFTETYRKILENYNAYF